MRTWKNSAPSAGTFFMGIGIGAMVAIMIFLVVWWEILRPRYMSAIDDMGKLAIANAKKFDECQKSK